MTLEQFASFCNSFDTASGLIEMYQWVRKANLVPAFTIYIPSPRTPPSAAVEQIDAEVPWHIDEGHNLHIPL